MAVAKLAAVLPASRAGTHQPRALFTVKALKRPTHSRPGTKTRAPRLARCQVSTPLPIVELVWTLVNQRRPSPPTNVIDLGAGDGRFSKFGSFGSYTGYELDPTHRTISEFPANANMVFRCALDAEGSYDAAVGNPPFIRNQDIGVMWRNRARRLIESELGVTIHGLQNLYIYFLWLAILRTTENGVLGLVLPFEWISRPSAREIRNHIRKKGWEVIVYRIPKSERLFPNVKTTASIAIIDKGSKQANWSFYDVDIDVHVQRIDHLGEPLETPLFEYARRNPKVYATRGFSPGSLAVFTLTEDERRRNSISLAQVVPCVTSLRPFPKHLTRLDASAFQKYYVNIGRRCWLLKTHAQKPSTAVRTWLDAAPAGVRLNWTCRNRSPWFAYNLPGVPRILYAAGFRGSRPKIVANAVGARNVGSVHGIFGKDFGSSWEALHAFLRRTDFGKGIIPHARGLKKLEVGQMNAILNRFVASKKGSA